MAPTTINTGSDYIAPHDFEQQLEIQQGRKRYYELQKATTEADTAKINASTAVVKKNTAAVDLQIAGNQLLTKQQQLIQSAQKVTVAVEQTKQGEIEVGKAQYTTMIAGATAQLDKRLQFLQGEGLMLQVAQVAADNESQKVVLGMRGVKVDGNLPNPPSISAPRIAPIPTTR